VKDPGDCAEQVAWSLSYSSIAWFGLLLTGSLLVFVVPLQSAWPLVAAAIIYVTTVSLGFSIGYHRALIHRSLSMPRTLFCVILWIGSVAGLGGPIAVYRSHNLRDYFQNLSQSPRYFSSRLGFFESVFLFLFTDCVQNTISEAQLVPNHVNNDRIIRAIERYQLISHLLVVIGLYVMGGIQFVIWGFFVRVLFTMLTFSGLNYFCHTRGRIDYDIVGAAESGRNNLFFGIVFMGEGWHNNHHAFPQSCQFGIGLRQPDFSYVLILLLNRFDLFTDIQRSCLINAKKNAIRRHHS
jgi:fatty-acid desaturase